MLLEDRQEQASKRMDKIHSFVQKLDTDASASVLLKEQATEKRNISTVDGLRKRTNQNLANLKSNA